MNPIRTSQPPPAIEEGFNLREIFNFIWRQWKFIAAITGIAFCIGIVWLATETPLYTSTAQVLLQPEQGNTAATSPTDALLNAAVLDPAMIDSQIAIITSTEFLRRIVKRQKLTFDPEFAPNHSVIGIIRSYFSSANKTTQQQVPQPSPADIVQTIKGAIAVKRDGQSYIISISATSMDPAHSVKLANTIADAYIVDQLDARFDAAQRASSWLNDRLTELRKQLHDSEEAVAKFRADHGMSQNASVTLNQQQLSDLNARLVAARAEAAEKKARYVLLRSIEAKGGNALSLPDVASTGTLQTLRAQADALSQKEADLSSHYSNSHPRLVNVRAERRDVQRALTAELERVSANIKNEYELAKAREKSIEDSANQVSGQAPLDNETSITLRELERTAQVNKTLFEDYLHRSKVTEEQSTFTRREARVITYAVPTNSPSYPIKGRVLSIAVALGLLLGIGGAIANEMLDTGFKSSRQVEEALEIPVLASVAKVETDALIVDGKKLSLPMSVIVKPLSRYSEAFRSLRSGIPMTDVDDPPKLLQFTSTVPGEGKTSIAMSFAAGAAHAGLKVLFIDCDLRRPAASKLFGLAKRPGLVDMLINRTSASDAIKFIDDMKFWVLPAGSHTQNPSDVLGSERMKSLCVSFKGSFDYVVFDTPPLGPVIDPAVVTQIVDKVIYVVRFGTTPRELVHQSILQLRGEGKIAGIVFNKIIDAEAKKYGRYGYAHAYRARSYKNYYSE